MKYLVCFLTMFIGAVCSYALVLRVEFIDIVILGYILMALGALALLVVLFQDTMRALGKPFRTVHMKHRKDPDIPTPKKRSQNSRVI